MVTASTSRIMGEKSANQAHTTHINVCFIAAVQQLLGFDTGVKQVRKGGSRGVGGDNGLKKKTTIWSSHINVFKIKVI